MYPGNDSACDSMCVRIFFRIIIAVHIIIVIYNKDIVNVIIGNCAVSILAMLKNIIFASFYFII